MKYWTVRNIKIEYLIICQKLKAKKKININVLCLPEKNFSSIVKVKLLKTNR